MIVKTDAIVMKSMRYRETSKIVTFYTQQYGKLSALAKGARDTKNKFGASLEPMTLVSLVMYRKEHRTLQLVSQCDILRSYKNIHSEMDRMGVGLSVLELLGQLTHDEEENPSLFSLVQDTFNELEAASSNYKQFLFAFELRFSALFGFRPKFDQCMKCGKELGRTDTSGDVMFQLDKGGWYCTACASESEGVALGVSEPLAPYGRRPRLVRVHSQVMEIMHRLLDAKLETIPALRYDSSTGNELSATLRSYLQYHFEELRPLRSEEMFGKMTS